MCICVYVCVDAMYVCTLHVPTICVFVCVRVCAVGVCVICVCMCVSM